MIPSSRRPAGGRFVRLALAGVLGLAFLGWLGFRNHEPVYQGKTLTDWLYDKDYTVWIPNDFYGHIHNEFWESLVAGGYAAREGETKTALNGGGDKCVNPAVFVTQRLGTNAIPRLLELLSSRPGLSECCADRISATIPGLSPFLHGHPLFQTAEGRRIASWKGFGALGTNAESALPALQKMLCRPEADFLLSSTIAEIGPRGVDVLLNALTNQDDHVVSVAAFALGWLGPAANSAMPALVDLVAQGRASYQVLGALGRLGAYPELVIPKLSAYLQKANELPQASLENEMAMLILGLYGEQSRPVVPVLLKLYEDPDKTRRQVIRVVLKHIDPKHVQVLLGRVPSTRDDEDPWWGGAVD